MRKKILIGAVAIFGRAVIGIAALAWWGYWAFTGPMYVPGNLATAGPLRSPAHDGSGKWAVQPGIELHHFSLGVGRPVLFVHGGPGFPTRQRMSWLERIWEAFELNYYDQRGCGLSSRPFDQFENPNTWANMQQLEATLGLGAQIADIERIRRILGEEKLVLIGHSFGGFLAALYAAEFPDRVEKLVLLAPADMLVMPAQGDDMLSLVGDQLPDERRAEYDTFLDEYMNFGALFEHDEHTLAARNLQLAEYVLEGMGLESLPEDAEADAGGWMVFAMYLSMGKRHDYTEALARITADTLVVHGENDLVPSSSSKRYADQIPGAELVLVPDADHFFLGEHRDLYLRVNAFLRDAVRPQTRVPIGSVSWSEPVDGLVLGIEAPPPFKYTPIKDWTGPLFVRTDDGGGRGSMRGNPAGTWDAGAVFHVWLKNESTETRYWAEYDGAWAVAFTGAGLTKSASVVFPTPMPLWRGPLPLAPGTQASMTFHVWSAYPFAVVGPVDAGEYELSVRYAPADLVRMAYGDDVHPYDVPGFWVDEIQTPTITVTVEHVPDPESSLTGPG